MDLEQHASAEDVLQESFADVFRGIGNLEQKNWPGFVAWLRTIVDNRIAMMHRSIRARKRGAGQHPVEYAEAQSLMASLAATSRSPRSWLACQEGIERVQLALADLDSTQRAVLRMRFNDGWDYERIGRELGKKDGTARTLAYRAIRQLRVMLGNGPSSQAAISR